MSKEITVDLRLDTRSRRKRKDGTYPVSLYVYDPLAKRARVYATIFAFTEKDFDGIWLPGRPREEKPKKHLREIRKKLDSLIKKATRDLEEMESFTFEAFKSRLITPKADQKNVFLYYQNLIKTFRDEKKSISTASWYECSRNSLNSFLEHQKSKKDTLDLSQITVKWLERYEQFMKVSGRSRTTIAMYLRALRAVLKSAIAAGAMDPHLYPFGKEKEGKYSVREGGKFPKALNLDEIKTLSRSQPETIEQERAKAFWFFSFFSNGMNIIDILNLRYKQISLDSFEYERMKTRNRTKTPVIISVPLNAFTREVIRKYGSTPTGYPNQLVFPILTDTNTPEQNHNKTHTFIRFINQHIKKLAMANGITGEISTYYARHSFATGLLRKRESPGFIQEALGHSSIITTQRYLAGFNMEEKNRVANEMYHDFENFL